MKRPDLAARNYRHGMAGSKIYWIWAAMLDRCRNQRNSSYANYGGRGIRVCKKWYKFEEFFADMGAPPPHLTLERKNNDGNYLKRNCVWATRVRQANNTRKNVILTFGGLTMSIADWARHLGITQHMIKTRLSKYGWSVHRTLSNPRDMRIKENRGVTRL